MIIDDKIRNTDDLNDRLENGPEVQQALQHFRESVHAWSAAEYGRSRAPVRLGSFLGMRIPVLSWTAAAAIAIAGVSVPVVHRIQVDQQKHEAYVRDQQRIADEAAAKQRAYAMDDEDLLKHVDSDIAQGTPDAMEPLASLMTDPAPKK